MKPVRCPGPTPDVFARKTPPGCRRITAEPINGALKYTADAAGPEHGFRCFEHTRDKETGPAWAAQTSKTGPAFVRGLPSRDLPSPAEQARARADMARYQAKAAEQDKVNRRLSAAYAAERAARGGS